MSLPTLILFNFRFFIQPQNDAYFAKFYMKTYTRAGPYILGSILGYVLHNYKGEKLSSVIICFSTWQFAIIITNVLKSLLGLGLLSTLPHSLPPPEIVKLEVFFFITRKISDICNNKKIALGAKGTPSSRHFQKMASTHDRIGWDWNYGKLISGTKPS